MDQLHHYKAPTKQFKQKRLVISPKLQAAKHSLFLCLIKEAENLMRKESYEKAVQIISNAIRLKKRLIESHQGDIYFYCRERVKAIILRSQCWLKLDNPRLAIEDANLALGEIALATEKTTLQPFALLARAEALFTKGEFELALIDFHHGAKDRPDIEQFLNGVKKTQESIHLAIGDISAARMRQRRKAGLEKDANVKKGQDSFVFPSGSLEELKEERTRPGNMPLINSVGKRTYDPDKFLLEELITDKQFLLEISQDKVFMDAADGTVGDLVANALGYLKERADFWRQRNPTASPNPSKSRPASAPRVIRARSALPSSTANGVSSNSDIKRASRPQTAGEKPSSSSALARSPIRKSRKNSEESAIRWDSKTTPAKQATLAMRLIGTQKIYRGDLVTNLNPLSKRKLSDVVYSLLSIKMESDASARPSKVAERSTIAV